MVSSENPSDRFICLREYDILSLDNMQQIESFHQGDGEEFYYKYLHKHGWIQLWRPAPYHWVAMNIKGRSILSYTEGDVTKTMYPDEDSFMKALQDTKDWWVENQGKSANPVLCGNAEPYGFLTGDPINLNPPRCPVCNRMMYPDSNKGQYSCLVDPLHGLD